MTRYLLDQRFLYRYTGPITSLQHRLMVVPPAVHGDQGLVCHRVDVTGAEVETRVGEDRFGNSVLHVRSPMVEDAIAFDATVEVERGEEVVPAGLAARALRDPAYLQPTPLTALGPSLLAAAAELAAAPGPAMDLAERISTWVHGRMRYAFDATTVKTTATEALDLGAGVCQDYAHVMVAVARACGLPARYVSGHLLGEGGSHAWVEVLVEDQVHPDRALAVAFDPTHDRRAHRGYVTVAVGRDYADVAPTAGTFESDGATGRLSTSKRLVAAEPAAAEPAAP